MSKKYYDYVFLALFIKQKSYNNNLSAMKSVEAEKLKEND